MEGEEIKMKKIIQTQWRCGTIGIVAVERDAGWCAYIGIVPGTDEETDAQYVADWGEKLTEEEAVGFFPSLKNKTYDY